MKSIRYKLIRVNIESVIANLISFYIIDEDLKYPPISTIE